MTTGPTYGAVKVAKERARQIDRKGYTPEHDAQHKPEEFVNAALAYAGVSGVWPWGYEHFKPSDNGDYEADLIKAGALIVAAIDRLHGTIETSSDDDSTLMSAAGHFREGEKLLAGAREDLRQAAAMPTHTVENRAHRAARLDIAQLALQAAQTHIQAAAALNDSGTGRES